MGVNDIFTHRLPVAAVNRTAFGFSCTQDERGRAIRLMWLMSMHMQWVEGESVQLSRGGVLYRITVRRNQGSLHQLDQCLCNQ